MKHARACVFFYKQFIKTTMARNRIHAPANETFIKNILFISLSSMASPYISKKNTSNI